ncbi:hypothetical protein ACNFU2_07395 [Chryseobacterium sp. PTM-20240506]|uniref:hypothetical protein n=1 Tax=unclassified Chryseobacterium TaxID=2593645 RepID=UPI00235A23FF|nr:MULTISPECIES: hypothetical protein [unclassified Chryseobacterium]MDC8104617.1 hypothetical protein [Chryseobacterium sp. B21-037]MDQ1806158.1 hypothetical protein [Chryseobacterium sp. CKR4-1]
MKNLKNLPQKLTKRELKKITGGNDPDLSYPMCTPRQCETLDMKCDRLNSCPPLYPDPD